MSLIRQHVLFRGISCFIPNSIPHVVVRVIDKTLLTDRRKLSISSSATSKNISATSKAWTYLAVFLLIFQGILYSQFTRNSAKRL